MLDEKTKAELAEIKVGLEKIKMWVEADEFDKIEKKVLVSFKDFKCELFKRTLERELKN